MHRLRFACTAAAVAILLAIAPLAQAQRLDAPQKIEVRAQAIESFDPRDAARARFGALTFRGGLVLTSPHRDFGGISSIRVAADGVRFIAVTDRGNWVRGRIVYRARAPVAIADAEIAPILGADGRPLNRRGWYDSESLAEDGGTLYVGFERVHGIARFDYGRQGLRARGQTVAVPAGVKALPNNRSLECLVVPPKGLPHAGTLIAISEGGLDTQGNIQGFLLGGATPGTFSVKRSDDFEITDCATTPRGDLLILERRFSWARGVAMRIRRLSLARVAPGAVLEGPELIFADMGFQIDNMEGLSVHAQGEGTLVLTLTSDDNFSPLQRTVLLQFTLSE